MPSHWVEVVDVAVGTTVVSAIPRGYKGAILMAGSAAATLTVYDNTAASGDIKDELKAPIDSVDGWIRDKTQVIMTKGITVVVAGTGAKGKIHMAQESV